MDNESRMRYRILGKYQGSYIYLYSFPTYAIVKIGTVSKRFRNYDEAVVYLRRITSEAQQQYLVRIPGGGYK